MNHEPVTIFLRRPMINRGVFSPDAAWEVRFLSIPGLTMPAFPGVSSIPYEGPCSKNPLAFRHYNPEELVEGKSMRGHLRFPVTCWHPLRGTGAAGPVQHHSGRQALIENLLNDFYLGLPCSCVLP